MKKSNTCLTILFVLFCSLACGPKKKTFDSQSSKKTPSQEEIQSEETSTQSKSQEASKQVDKQADAAEPIPEGLQTFLNTFEGKAGFSVAVLKDGKTLLKRGVGLADVETKRRTTPKTMYHLASVSKMFTALGISVLKDKGLLDVNASIRKYLPTLPQWMEPVTVEGLVQMRGISPIETASSPQDPCDTQTLYNKDVVGLFSTEFPGFNQQYLAVNAEPYYYNEGYMLLGSIIESIATQSFNMTFYEFMNQQVFQPLKMINSGFFKVAQELGMNDVATKYDNELNPSQVLFAKNCSDIYGNVGAYSNIEDMIQYVNNLPTLLTQPSYKRIFEPGFEFQRDPPSDLFSYGYGWEIIKGYPLPKPSGGVTKYDVHVHQGHWLGSRTLIMNVLSENLWIVMLSHNGQSTMYDNTKVIVGHFLSK